MANSDYMSLLIDQTMNPDDYEKWDNFLTDIDMRGQTFGDAEVQRALAAGYTTQDVNDYLKWSGITPTGSFAVGGYNETQVMGGSGDGAGFSTQKNPYYTYIGSATAPPAAPTNPYANPGAVQTYVPTPMVQDNFNPGSLQIKIPESDPMIAQLQQSLINSVKPPDTTQFTNQLTGIQNTVQQIPSGLANQPALGSGVSLDSFSKVFQAEAAATAVQPPAPTINTDVSGLMKGYADQLSIAQGMFGTPKLDPSVPNVENGYNNQLTGLQSQFNSMTAMENQAGWRAKAALQSGSQSAGYVQSAQLSGATGTDKLNRNSTNTSNNNYFNTLTIGDASANPQDRLKISGVSI